MVAMHSESKQVSMSLVAMQRVKANEHVPWLLCTVELKLTQLHEQLTAIITARVHPKHGAFMCKKYKYEKHYIRTARTSN